MEVAAEAERWHEDFVLEDAECDVAAAAQSTSDRCLLRHFRMK